MADQRARDAASFADMLAGLLPEGPFWQGFRDADGEGRKLLIALALLPAEVDAAAWALVLDANPLTVADMLASRETEAGLPDTCIGQPNTTAERIALLVAKWRARGGASPAYFTALAASLGYEVEIEEFRPFECGVSECGDLLNGPEEVRFEWAVSVPGPRVTDFECGLSECGDLLGDIDRAEDLECLIAHGGPQLTGLKPAHTHVYFSYEGA